MIGQNLSHYRVSRKLGAGGMGDVYLATDTKLGRQVALKLLPQEHTQDAQRLRRFNQEAKAASALNHPNILTIYEFGEADGHHFIATEFIDGRSLRTALEETGRLSVAEALEVAVQVASALASAHEAGIIHRDIKPDNVMVRSDGYVKVLDFGLAKLTEATSPGTPVTSDARTVSGVVLGTTQYMSPEQATGGRIDARSDIFSFGAMLYELVTGQRAFKGDSPMTIVTAILTGEPAPLPPTVPAPLMSIIQRCLRKDPARRFQTMPDLKAALEDARDAASVATQRYAPSKRALLWGIATSAVIALGIFVWRELGNSDPGEPARAVPLTTLPGLARYPSFAPSADRVVFTWSGTTQNNPDIWVQQVDGGTPLRLTTDAANDFNPVWSPDGRLIAFLRARPEPGRHEVRVIPPLGGPDRMLTEIHVGGGTVLTPPWLTWCADSSCLIATHSPGGNAPDALFVISLETGDKRQLTHPASPALGDISPAVSPDGSRLVFRRSAGLFVGELYELSLNSGMIATGEPRRLTIPTLNAEYPVWMPDGREILFSARGSLWRLRTGGDASPARLPFVGEYGQMPAVSRAQPGRPSQLVYVRSFEDGNIWRLETDAPGAAPRSAPSIAIASTRLDDMPQLSPDARRVVFTSDRSGDWEIWLSDTDGGNAVALTSMKAVAAGYPHWSANGDQVVFHSNVDGQWDVYVVAAAGGRPRRVTDHPTSDDFPSFSRDGRSIYFSSNRGGGQQQSLWKVAVAGGNPTQVAARAAYAAQESPDSAHVYYVETIDAPSALWRMPVTGGPAEKVLDGVYLANYAVLAGGIYYVERVSGGEGVHYVDLPLAETRLQYFDFRTRRSTTIHRDLGRVDLPITVSADGRLILYPRLDATVNDLMFVARFR